MPQKDPIGNIIIITLLSLLIVAGFISYRSIDWTVLQRLEKQQLVLPTPISPTIPATSSSN
jgi:hypothetical protein